MSGVEGQNKRTIKKKKTNNMIKSNQKVSTRDKNHIIKEDKTEIKSTIDNKLQNNGQIKETEEEIDIFEKTKKLEEELEKKKSEMESKAQIDIDKIKSLNENLSAFAKEKQLLMAKNNKILSEMKQIAQKNSLKKNYQK